MISKKLKFCSWNIHGYMSRQVGIKLRDPDFLKIISEVDFIGFGETHVHDEILEHLNVIGFKRIGYKNRKKNPKSRTASGGIAIFVKEDIAYLFSHVKTENEDTIWAKIKKEHTGIGKDIFIGTCYLSPEKGTKNSNVCSKLIDDILNFQEIGHIIINGDLNAKTGNLTDTIPPDKQDDIFCISDIDLPHARNSQDKSVNSRGNELLEICKSFDLYIANGRKVGDPFGNYTCFQWNGNSVVDYLVTSASIFENITTLRVGDYLPWLSDHCPLLFTLEIHKSIDTLSEKPPEPIINAPKQYTWQTGDTEMFLEALNSPEIDDKLSEILNLDHSNPNHIVDPLTEVLLKTANKAGVKTKTYLKNKFSNDPPWFDKTCTKMKNEIKTMGKRVRKNPLNQTLKIELLKLKRHLKKTVQKNKKRYKEEILASMNLSRKNSRQFWKLLEKLEHKENDEIFKQAIPEKKWTSYFKSVFHSTNQPNSGEFPKNTAEKGPLDYKISDEEIKLASYILRKGKATG